MVLHRGRLGRLKIVDWLFVGVITVFSLVVIILFFGFGLFVGLGLFDLIRLSFGLLGLLFVFCHGDIFLSQRR